MDLINVYISKSIKETLNIISKLGTFQVYLIVILITYALNLEILTKQLIGGIVVMTIIAIPIRLFLFKDRPKKMQHSNFLEKIKASSFPSMHSARFGFITFTTYLFTKSFELLLVLLGIYLIIIIQRVVMKKHDSIDIIGGIILAGATTILLINIKGF